MPLVNTPILHTIGAIAKRHFLIIFSALSIIPLGAIPVSAQAQGSVHINVPGFSISVHDNQYGNKRHRRAYRYRNDYYNNHDRSYRGGRRYYRDRRHWYKRDRSRWYKNNPYYNNYYYGHRSRRAEVCPEEGYSPYYNDNLNCYRHKDHFHCR